MEIYQMNELKKNTAQMKKSVMDDLKRGMFQFFFLLSNNFTCPILVYALLCFVECCQALGMIIYMKYQLSKDSFPDYLEKVFFLLRFIVSLESEGNFGYVQYILVSSCVWVITAAAAFGIIRMSMAKPSSILKQSMAVCFPSTMSFFIIFFKKVLLFPVCFVTAKSMSYFCDRLEDIHIILFFLSILVFLMTFLITGMSIYFFIDESPNSIIPWALADFRIEMVKAVKVIGSALIIALEDKFTYVALYLCVLALFDLFILYWSTWCCTYLNYSVQVLDIACTLLPFIFSLFFTVFVLFFVKNYDEILIINSTMLLYFFFSNAILYFYFMFVI